MIKKGSAALVTRTFKTLGMGLQPRTGPQLLRLPAADPRHEAAGAILHCVRDTPA